MAFQDVHGKSAIITGAGSGINFAFAKLLLSKGCNVVLADLKLRADAQEFVEAHKSGSPQAVFQETDVRDWTHLQRMFEVCEKSFGSADIVCPGAGVYEPAWSSFWIPPGTSPSVDEPDSGRYAILDINITHPVRTSQLAISHFMKHSKPGSIVHISSIAAQAADLVCPLYIVSKHAVSAFVRSMAMLEAPEKSIKPIRVTAVAPGIVRTPLWSDDPEKSLWIDEERDQWNTPEEVAEKMFELVTNEKYRGGTILEVSKSYTREVPLFNNPGPDWPTIGSSKRTYDPTWDRMASKGWGEVPQK